MTSLSQPHNRRIRRHDLIFVRAPAWRSMLEGRPDLANEPLVARWVESWWPSSGAAAYQARGRGALGLPLPPLAGKRRLFVLMQPEAIVATAPPPALS